jgi:DNA polymerase-3 subunit beta
MKLHCHRPSLLTAFQIVGGVVPTRTPKDILKNVKLQAAGGAATLIGTDDEVGIRYEIPGVEIEAGGETLLPANRTISILRELQDDGVDFSISDDTICIRSGHSEFKLAAIDPAGCPAVKEFEEQQYHAISASSLREAVRRTIFATDVESTRYALGGVLLELEPDAVTLAATDSRRLATVKAACRAEGGPKVENTTPVVPRSAMTLIERSIEGDEESEVLIAIHANDVLVKSGRSTICSRLVEGRFPKYKDVIPRDSKHVIDLVVGPFHAAVRQAQIVTNEESRGVDFSFANGQLTLNSRAADIGQSKVELPISFEGGDLTITFDPRYISEFLRVLDPEQQVKLHLTDGESAAVFRTDDAYTYVIMPLSRER